MSIRLKRKAFTLIELLVVISIIALLLSILMPSLQKTKEITLRVVCGSQMRQAAIVELQYATDYEKFAYRFVGANSTKEGAHENFNKEVINVWPESLFKDTWELFKKSYGGEADLFVCPAARRARGLEGLVKYFTEKTWEWSGTRWDGNQGNAVYKAGDLGHSNAAGWPVPAVRIGCVRLVGLTNMTGTRPSPKVSDSAVSPYDRSDKLLYADKINLWDVLSGWQDVHSLVPHKGDGGRPAGGNVAHLDGSVNWRSAGVLDRDDQPIPKDLTQAQGKYSPVGSGSSRLYFW